MRPGLRLAPSLATRNARFLLALAPGAALACAHFPALAWKLALAALLALLLEGACLQLRRVPLQPYFAEGAALRAALLLGLWLPTASLPVLLAAVAVATLARQALGGLGAHPFHGAMLGAAFAQLAFASAPLPVDAGAPWLALAWLGGGLALCAAGQVHWHGPLGLLSVAALLSLPEGASLAVLTGAPWMLAAFFVLGEPGGGGEHPRARLALGALAGALAALAAQGASAAALPFALLLANALAPLLSGWLMPRRRAA
jgi:Na+-translocating ferredoxin:NAD+ oxidoreductase RnfD subunit